MVTDEQVRYLFKLLIDRKTQKVAALKTGMSERTARRYSKERKLPSQLKRGHEWSTRENPFDEDWSKIKELLEVNSGLQAKTIFEWLQREDVGKYSDGQLRSLQRRIKRWRALEGPKKEVYFPQKHYPGRLGQSDFTDMSSLGITIAGEFFSHLIYHFVLTYSNWETGTICFSESSESLRGGIQNALWELGGVPERHQTDRLSTAVNKEASKEEFTDTYAALLRHYGLAGQYIQARKANENGDVEQSHNRFKIAVDQALMLRSSRDFDSRRQYEEFLASLFRDLNQGRRERFEEELTCLKPLPARRLEDCKELEAKVGKASSIRAAKNTYSVHSRLIGETVKIKLYAEYLEVWYAQKLTETIPRLRGAGKHKVQYRHVIDWLVRKPGAFENYRYKEDLFPTTYFRMAYDVLREQEPERANKQYLLILKLAKDISEEQVNAVLRGFVRDGKEISAEAIKQLVTQALEPEVVPAVSIQTIDLGLYDALLDPREEKLYYEHRVEIGAYCGA